MWLTKLANSEFVDQGEFIDVKQFSTSIQLNKVRTAGLKIRLDNPLASFIATRCSEEPLYIRSYRENLLMFHGQLEGVEEEGNEKGAFLTLTAAGPEANIAKRIPSINPELFKKWPEEKVSISKRFKELLEYCEAHAGAESGTFPLRFTHGSIEEVKNKTPFEVVPLKFLSDMLKELSQQIEGFDWLMTPTEANAGNIGDLVIKEVIHADQPNAVFEWNAGRNNTADFKRKIDMSKMLTDGFNVTGGGPTAPGAPLVQFKDNPSVALWGLKQESVPLNVLVTEVRQRFVEENIAVRKKPQQTFSFTPNVDDGTQRVPQLVTDYNIGDSVPVKIVYEGTTHFDAMVRAWGIKYEVDENEKEKQTLTASNEG